MPPSKIVIVGPTQAGKTCWLAALELAARRTQRPESRGYVCAVQARSPAMTERWEQARDGIIDKGSFDHIAGTTDVSDYDFDFTVNLNTTWWEKMLSRGEVALSVRVVDAPGGVAIPVKPATGPKAEKDRLSLLEHAREAEGLVICVDATDEMRSSAFGKELPRLLQRVRNPSVEDGASWRPFKRVAVILTKADLHFSSLGKTERQMRGFDPWSRAWNILPHDLHGDLHDYLRDYLSAAPKIACGWTSIYGFISDTGEPNYDAASKRLRTHDPNRAAAANLELWQPYQILDPLIFLATGELGSLRLLRG